MSMNDATQPLAPATFLILLALASGEKHGYAIMREARALSEGSLEIGPATLYTTIRRLLDLGWIEEVESPEGADSRRRYYALTKDGQSALHTELERMKLMVRKARGLRLHSPEAIS